MSELAELKRIIEGAILASESPLTIDNLESLFIVESPTRSEIRDAIAEIEADCESRGFELKKVATGYRFQVKEKYSEWVGRLWEERAPRYTRALLETLALIAYKQPITRGDIEEIRGVAVSTNIIRTLLEREWVRVVGHRDVPGRPAMYATTKHFLDYFNVASLEELPTLQEIKDIAAEEASLAIEEPLIEMTSIELEPEDLELEGANETDLDAVSQQVDQIQENIRQAMALRPEERDEDWDVLEPGDSRGEQTGNVLAMESEEELLLDDSADDTADDREGGNDPEPDIGLDQNKDV